ncbi:glycosyltransferase family 4 protein [Desulfotalea psychrophila]|uniref:Related to polysaccharide biosynthesis protein n=1 Tax=Desulfotalea psychrophila (strain LSv54 / DSM 12343) TaxID=177439 RepID=Q6AIA8_DESPS|nr:glycosyltransferase family 4 protein [Desulfotalea psychrophila]CAG37939.1 related to polysaccharide biosynthesis protein [Desulfotalea psychrophila LSv54]
MINKKLSNKVLMIGVNYKKNAKGGMASVIQNYDKIFEHLQYITTWADSNLLYKILIFIKAYVCLFFILVFRKKIKILHFHSASNSSFKRISLLIKLGNLFNKKIIIHIHGGGFIEFYNSSRNKCNILRALNSCHRLIVLSNNWQNWFVSLGIDETKIYVLNNIINYPVLDNKTHIYAPKIRLLFLGNIIKQKGIFDLVQTIIENKSKYKDIVSLKIGGDKEIYKLNNIIKNNHIQNIIQYKGWVTGTKKINLLNWCNIFILPSYMEAMPISILEAMSYNCCIIATKVGGIPDIVIPHKNGLLIAPQSKNKIEMAIDFFINNPELIDKYGQTSKEIIKNYYPDIVINKLKNIYYDLLKEDK